MIRKLARQLRVFFKTVRRYGPAYRRRFGWRAGWRTLRQLRLTRPNDAAIAVHIPHCRAPVWVRPATSDVLVFEQVFLDEDYLAPHPIDPTLIIDGGANVGYATVYLANQFPQARIVAVEPGSDNVALLRRNIAPYEGITIVEAGIWSRATTLAIANPDAGPWALRVEEVDEGTGVDGIRAVTLPMLLADHGPAQLVKLDIEGSELAVFSADTSWLADVELLFAELHESLAPGCTAAFDAAIAPYNFRETPRQGLRVISK